MAHKEAKAAGRNEKGQHTFPYDKLTQKCKRFLSWAYRDVCKEVKCNIYHSLVWRQTVDGRCLISQSQYGISLKEHRFFTILLADSLPAIHLKRFHKRIFKVSSGYLQSSIHGKSASWLPLRAAKQAGKGRKIRKMSLHSAPYTPASTEIWIRKESRARFPFRLHIFRIFISWTLFFIPI